MDTERVESTVSTVSFRIDPKREARLDALVDCWKMSRSDVFRRLLEASEKPEALEAIERATWSKELLPSASGKYRVHRDHVVSVLMGTGLPRIPHQFRAGEVLDRGGYPVGSLEERARHGLMLQPVD